MDLELKPAAKEDLMFAWSLYSDFVRQNMFSGRPGRRPETDWKEAAELQKFTDRWGESTQYVITVDEEPIGWVAIKIAGKVLTIENWHVRDDWRKKGVSKIILNSIVPEWKKDGSRIETDLLMDSPFASDFEGLLAQVGFFAFSKRVVA